MIHLTVAMPLGIDSVFFSFIERLAIQNGHFCVDPPAQNLDEETPLSWIDFMQRSAQHYFIIGYRYPPRYWSLLADRSASVLLISDPDGIVRQLESICINSYHSLTRDAILNAAHAIRPALEATISLASLMLSDESSQSTLMAPAHAFSMNPIMALSRIEKFYSQVAVNISEPSFETFANEAVPFIEQLKPVDSETKRWLQQYLLLEDTTPKRLSAVASFFDACQCESDEPLESLVSSPICL